MNNIQLNSSASLSPAEVAAMKPIVAAKIVSGDLHISKAKGAEANRYNSDVSCIFFIAIRDTRVIFFIQISQSLL